MRFFSTIMCTSFLLATVLPTVVSAQEAVVTRSDIAAVVAKIERNWHSNAGESSLCKQVIELRVRLKEDGTVTGTETLAGEDGTVACRQLAESARRAVLMASPLKLPEGATFSSIKLRFNPPEFQP